MLFELPSTRITDTPQQMLGQIDIAADNSFSYSAAEYQNQSVNYFYTYLGNRYSDTTKISAGNFSTRSSNRYNVPAGKYYPYYYFSVDPELSDVNMATKITNLSGDTSFFLTPTSDIDAGISIPVNQPGYIWVLIPQNSAWAVTNASSIQQFAMSQWNEMTTLHTSVLLTLDSSRQEICYALRTEQIVPDTWHIGVKLS